ncbi:MAG: NAD(P)H-dependent glycerol-3-phosphate dehydrogenase [Alphaproteobacteria bacterium]
MTQHHIAIIGGGAWGTALALSMERANNRVSLWVRNEKEAVNMALSRINSAYLPEITIPPTIHITHDIKEVMTASIWLLAIPAQQLLAVVKSIPTEWAVGKIVLICAKGLCRTTGQLLSPMVEKCWPQASIGILSGPSFAREVALGQPTALSLGIADQAIGQDLVTRLASRYLRLYWNDDVIGIQVAGASKNVIALACGLAIGLGLGENARAALMTRGLHEMAKLGVKFGGQRETFMGLCGVGDLVLTATSLQSRNYTHGIELGQYYRRQQPSPTATKLVEGISTAAAISHFMAHTGEELPICTAVDHIINHHADIEKEIERLLSRPLKAE